MRRAMERHPEVPFWLCVGDVASHAAARIPNRPRPLYWIKGNNEDFDRIAEWTAGRDQVPNLHYIPNGTARKVGVLNVAGLGGTLRAHVVRDVRREPAASAERRQAAAFRAGRGRGVQAAERRRHPDDPRGCAAVHHRRRAGRMERRPRRRDAGKPAINDRAGDNEAAAAPLRDIIIGSSRPCAKA